VTPYVKAEALVMFQDDPFFLPNAAAGTRADYDVYDAAVGARWDMSSWCAAKAEYRLDYFPGLKAYGHTVVSSWQFAL
jgi:hypothetical protein